MISIIAKYRSGMHAWRAYELDHLKLLQMELEMEVSFGIS